MVPSFSPRGPGERRQEVMKAMMPPVTEEIQQDLMKAIWPMMSYWSVPRRVGRFLSLPLKSSLTTCRGPTQATRCTLWDTLLLSRVAWVLTSTLTLTLINKVGIPSSGIVTMEELRDQDNGGPGSPYLRKKSGAVRPSPVSAKAHIRPNALPASLERDLQRLIQTLEEPKLAAEHALYVVPTTPQGSTFASGAPRSRLTPPTIA